MMSAVILDRARLVVFFLAAWLALSGCQLGGADNASEERVPPRVELLTLDEALGGQGELSPQVGIEDATSCGPDWSVSFPHMTGDTTPDVVRFDRGDWWVAVGVWDDDGWNDSRLKSIARHISTDVCRLGQESAELQEGDSLNWRVYPVDMGEGIVAFQAVEWSLASGDRPPSTPLPREDLHVRSTVRAYGIVNDKLVMARISHYEAEPPSAEDLKVLWDAQVAKVRYVMSQDMGDSSVSRHR